MENKDTSTVITGDLFDIDNGGVDISITSNDDITKVEVSCMYYGLPFVSSVINITESDIEILEMFKEVITHHIAKLKLIEK